MKIFSPHRRKMEASRRFGSKEFQNKIKKAQGYRRIFDSRGHGFFSDWLKKWHLNSPLIQLPSIAVVGAVFYFLFISDYFLVNQISVEGVRQIPADQVQSIISEAGKNRWLLIPKNHLLLMSKGQALALLSEQQPLVKEIGAFKRVWPNKVALEIVERTPGFSFIVDGKNYLVDDDGVVVKELNDSQGLTPVFDQVTEDVVVGERLNNSKLVAFVISAIKNWPNKINPQIKEMKVPGKAATQVQIVSNEGWSVFFDTGRAVESQLSNLSLILSRQIPAKDRLKLAYIDLRFDKWAYYCYKDAPCESQPQTAQAPNENGEKLEVN